MSDNEATPQEIASLEERTRITIRLAEAKQTEEAWRLHHERTSAELAHAVERSAGIEAELVEHDKAER